MQVSVTLYGPPREAVDGKTLMREIESGATVMDLFAALSEEYPEFERSLFTSDGSLPQAINVTVNGMSINRSDGLDTRLNDGDELRVAPALEGG